ncbi:hypothetical protein SLS60_009780 [Paraconiothyrium brasiliense]|uniref:Asl1-like glycosyl hydrolase catalytic domain-containing protein n=1 Tax=Paraconiothyrium brasiliense TaxID=300254 RepID=A0ABR3QSQ2_9PLEO
MKFSVLALAGAAAAIPQYNVGHGHASAHKHYTPSAGTAGHAYPTGGWGHGYNGTSTPSAVAQGTGSASKPAGEQTTYTESDYTITSTTTRTVYLTQYPSSSAPTEVAIKDVTTEAACGQTVYITETNRVTVTVPAGGASAPASSAAPVASSSSKGGYEAAQPSVPAEKPSSAAAKPSSSAAPVASAPEASYEAATSFVLASSEAEKPTSVAAVSSAAVYSTPAASAEAVTSAAPASSVQESSAAASASSTPSTGYAGGKRGLAYRWDGAADCKSFEGKNFGFVWNWEADTKGDVGSFAANFIPTLRTLDNAGDWAEKAQAAIDAGSKVLFGLNEPDIASQANLGVSALCDAWKAHMNDFYGKATIVGPSVSSSETEGQGLSYLSQFVEQCPEAKFDDINIHWYGPATAGFDAFKSHYESAKSKFSGKKIWVTEFGLTGATEQESADFLKSAQEYLDGESTCAGYSYFAVGTFDAAANLLGTATALTKAGEVYVS